MVSYLASSILVHSETGQTMGTVHCFYVLIFISLDLVSGLRNIDNCGQLSVGEPAIAGRNVTFAFRPNFYNKNATLKWERTNKRNPWAFLDPERVKFTQLEESETFYLILTNTELKNDEVFYRIQYYNGTVNCTMETTKLSLIDISQDRCGFLYLRTSKITEGENVEIEYYPTHNEINDVNNAHIRRWMRNDYDLHLMPGVYEENELSNDIYTLTIVMYKARMNGNYSVQCYSNYNLTYYSNSVTVILPVRPSQPVLSNLSNIENCTKCIVGENDQQFQVHCKFTGGTKPMSVNISIGNTALKAVPGDDLGGYIAFFYLRNEHHMAKVKCSIQNDALPSALTTTAQVYVIKPPESPSISAPDVIKEGDDVNITCTFVGGRPAPNLYLQYPGGNESSTVPTINTFISTDQTYTSVITLKEFRKDWNNAAISCCRQSAWYLNKSRCYEIKRINFLFPPSNISLQIVASDDGSTTRVYALCTIHDSNPRCEAKWRAPKGSISELSENISSKKQRFGAWDSTYRAEVDTSKNFTGEKIVCSADCPDFSTSIEKSVLMPYAPRLRFNTSSDELDLPIGDMAFVSCKATSTPFSNISWAERDTDGIKRIIKQCDLDIECVVAVSGNNITTLKLYCDVHHIFGYKNKELTVNIIESRATISSDRDSPVDLGNNMLQWILVGAAVGVVTMVILVSLMVRNMRKNTNEANPDINQVEENSASISDGSNNGEVMAEAVYSQINKTTGNNGAASRPIGNAALKAETKPLQPPNDKKDNQLVYADLVFDVHGPQPARGSVMKRRDSPTEYVGIDFAKTAHVQVEYNEHGEGDADNIYANQ